MSDVLGTRTLQCGESTGAGPLVPVPVAVLPWPHFSDLGFLVCKKGRLIPMAY